MFPELEHAQLFHQGSLVRGVSGGDDADALDYQKQDFRVRPEDAFQILEKETEIPKVDFVEGFIAGLFEEDFHGLQ